MLDDDAGGLCKGLHTFQSGIRVGNVVVGQFLALQLHGGADAGLLWGLLDIEGRLLVRILAVTHVLTLDELCRVGAGESGRQGLFGRTCGHQAAEIIRNGRVVSCGMLIGAHRKVEARGITQSPSVVAKFCNDAGIVGGVYDNANPCMILGSSTQHGGPANIDVLNGRWQITARPGNCGFERVKIHNDQVYGRYAMFLQHCLINVAPRENATVNLWMQSLDSAVHHFGEAGVVGDLDGRDLLCLQKLVRASCRENFDAGAVQRFGK